MKLNKFLCLFVLLAVVFAFASCGLLESLGIGGTTEVETFEVKFDSKGGSEVPSQTVEKDALVTEPEAPTREGVATEALAHLIVKENILNISCLLAHYY